MRTARLISLLIIFPCLLASFGPQSPESRLREWRKGVWLLPDGTFTIYTDAHYFVLQAGGDSAAPNIYCGASQLRYHAKGMARKQIFRLRQSPGAHVTFFSTNVLRADKTESPMEIDASLFSPGTCNFKAGILYDAITQMSDTCILLSTCNGDHEKIFSNGTSVYLPAGGGEAYAYRVEQWR